MSLMPHDKVYVRWQPSKRCRNTPPGREDSRIETSEPPLAMDLSAAGSSLLNIGQHKTVRQHGIWERDVFFGQLSGSGIGSHSDGVVRPRCDESGGALLMRP